jgi:outer membrane protein TolC
MKFCSSYVLRAITSGVLSALLLPGPEYMWAQNTNPPSQPAAESALRLDIPHSYNWLSPYRPTKVPAPNLVNSPRIDSLIRDGKMYLSLQDAIMLSLENNLDLAIARYNIPIAKADVLRTQAGGSFRGVNTGIVSNTPGGTSAVSAGGAGAGGTTGGAGGAGTGASGLVTSTLGTGTNVSSFDPSLSGTVSTQHSSTPVSNTVLYGVPVYKDNNWNGSFGYGQAFPTGTSLSFSFNSTRDAVNSINSFLNPYLTATYQVAVQQQLLAGFGFGPNLRFLRIAKNNQQISDEAFKLQVVSTITQIENMYWDLVSAYDDEDVKKRSLDFAERTLEDGRKQLQLQAIPAMDVLKDEAEVANREQDLTIARTTLRFQELLIKNALTKNLDDPVLEAMPVIPTTHSDVQANNTKEETEDLIGQALDARLELRESQIDLVNRNISKKAAENALLPTLSLTGSYAGSGLAGVNNPLAQTPSTAPVDYSSAVSNAFNNSSPNYFVGFSLNIPLRNRVAKSDQYRSELEYRQAELRLQQLKKQIRIEVRNAQYALQQSRARVEAAKKARDLAQKTFEIMKQEQNLGAGSNFQTLTAQRDLSTAESALVAAMTAYQKARVEVERAVGSTLEANAISIETAKTGISPEQRP